MDETKKEKRIIKSLLSKEKSVARPRPYWHVDAKWVVSILLSVFLAAWLLLMVAYQVTSRDVAVSIMKGAFQAFIDDIPLDQGGEAAVNDLRQRIAESPTKSIQPMPIPGSSVAITEADLDLPLTQLRDKIFSPILELAEPLYDKGVRALVAERTDDPAEQEEFAKQLSLVGAIDKQGHNVIGGWLLVVGVAVLPLLAMAVYFSDRFGRIVTPAIVLLMVSLPGLLLFSVLVAGVGQPTESVAEPPQDYLQQALANKGVLLPAATVGQNVYTISTIIAVGLIAATSIAKILHSVTNKGNTILTKGQ